MTNAETKTALVLRRDPAKGKIWSYIRQDWFVEFPEELVRQQFVCTLVNDYGFSLDQMGEELEVQRGREAAEADIVIWRTAKDKSDEKEQEATTAQALAQMTPEQAQQLLDAQKAEEQMLPPKTIGKPTDRTRPIRDW